ncbi:Holliday junction branch migration protein RuvA [Corynebacterium nuruki]|uniref:Holliday junction branch migration protein RuvA n=1 Tax=Corynebacterium nuruki TaxID=1032851 RepID=UPI0039BFA565
MIASLHGTVVDKGLDSVVVECGGVGYLCQATPRTLADLPGGAEVTVLTTMVVREDAMTLYAFSDAASREIFALVQTVSGVGARNALALLSVLTPGEIAGAVADGDVKALQRAPGVGKRLAERMAVDLKGKLDAYMEAAPAPTTPDGGAGAAGDAADAAVVAQVTEALTGLGFGDKEAAAAVAEVLADSADSATAGAADVSSVLRAALASLGGAR